MSDRSERELAAGAIDRNIVVEAGAGTGKTTLLIDRLTLLLLGGGRPVERLVALTFTEKAAAEIRVRLAERLHDVLEGKEFDVLARARELAQGASLDERARAALHGLDRAQIGTIHSFASHVLRLYPIEAGVDPAFAVDEGQEAEDQFDHDWARWLDDELAEASPRAERWLELLRHVELEHVATLARGLCQAKLEGRDVTAPATLAGAVAALADEADALARSHIKKDKPRKVEASLLSAAERLAGLAAYLRTGKASRESDEDISFSGSAPKDWGDAEFARAKGLVKLADSVSQASEARLSAAVALVAPFAARFHRSYGRKGWVSFDGLLVKARELVRTERRVREDLKARFDAFLIDEFQDTDPLQGELLLYLAEAKGSFAERWSEVRLGPGRLFVVGDPKQSIYRFRGADILAFERFTKLMLDQGAARCRLSVNFRSRPGILAAVNDVFPRIMREKAGSQAGYAALAPRPDAGAALGPVVELLKIDGDRSVDELRLAEAEAVADWIEARRADGMPYKDVAVLLRSFTPLRAYLDAFKRRGVPYVVEGEKYFYRAPEVLDFFNLLRAVDDPSDKVALLGTLRSPWAALDDADLLSLSRSGRLDYRKDAPGRAGEVFALLRELHALVDRRPVGEIVRRALASPCVIESAALAYHGEQTLANLLKFGRLASEASDEQGLSLKQFIHRLDGHVKELKEEGESPLADESLDAVRLLSIHKSKGLEFPVVVLPNLCGGMRGGDAPAWRLDWETGMAGLRLGEASNAALAVLEERELGRQQDEEVRVLYVAMTRPKDRLLLVGSGAPDKDSPAARLAQAGAWDGLSGWKVETKPYAEPALSRRAPPAAEAELDEAALVSRLEARVQLAEAASEPLFVAPSARHVPHVEPVEEGLSADRELGIRVGRLCHRTLELLDFNHTELWERLLVMAAEEFRREAPSEGWDDAESEAARVLEVFLASRACRELAKAEILAREMPFVYGEAGRVVRGAADLVCRLGGKLLVVDYKTDRLGSGDAKAHAERYREQGRCYTEAVSRALGEPASFRVVFLRTGEFHTLGS